MPPSYIATLKTVKSGDIEGFAKAFQDKLAELIKCRG